MPTKTKSSTQAAIRFWNDNYKWLKKKARREGGLARVVNLLTVKAREAEKSATKNPSLIGGENSD